MMTRAMTRTAVLATTAGLVTASLMGAASATGQTAQRTHLTIKSAHVRVTKTDKFKATITGTLRSHHAGVANEVVGVNERKAGTTKWTATGQTGTTDSNGKVVITLTQSTVREQYQLVFAGDTTSTPNYKASHSGTITVNAAKA